MVSKSKSKPSPLSSYSFSKVPWILLLTLKWRFLCLLNGHISSPDYVDYWVYNGYDSFSMQSNLIWTHDFWVFVLGVTRSHIPLNYKCRNKKNMKLLGVYPIHSILKKIGFFGNMNQLRLKRCHCCNKRVLKKHFFSAPASCRIWNTQFSAKWLANPISACSYFLIIYGARTNT